MTTFGDMVYMMGGIPAAAGIPFTTGNVYWVCSVTGSSSYEGTTPDRPKALIDQAINLCTADQGDIIVVMEGHTEILLNATTLVMDVSGITLWGLGHGRNRPVVQFNHANGKIIVSGTDIRIHNIVFEATITAVVTGIDVATTASDFTMDECEMNWELTGDDFAIMLLATAVTRLKLHRNRFIAEDTAGCNAAIQINGALDVEIIGNRITGDFTTSAINGVTTIAHELNISFNNIRNSDTTAGLALTLFTASTGIAAHNDIGSLYNTNITAIWVNESVLCIENKAVNVVTETAGATPASAST
jgi:hypothetical protein